MAAAHIRMTADHALPGATASRTLRAQYLAERSRGRIIGDGDWNAFAVGRAGFTLQGMARFPLLLGTPLSVPNPAGGVTTLTVGGSGGTVTIGDLGPQPMRFAFIDGECVQALEGRLSASELKQIDIALTASFDKVKDRWFAPMEVPWDVYMQMVAAMRKDPGYLRATSAFAAAADGAMEAAWGRR